MQNLTLVTLLLLLFWRCSENRNVKVFDTPEHATGKEKRVNSLLDMPISVTQCRNHTTFKLYWTFFFNCCCIPTHMWTSNKVKVIKSGMTMLTPSQVTIMWSLKDLALTLSGKKANVKGFLLLFFYCCCCCFKWGNVLIISLASARKQVWARLAFRCTLSAVWNREWSGRIADGWRVWNGDDVKLLIEVWTECTSPSRAKRGPIPGYRLVPKGLLTFLWFFYSMRSSVPVGHFRNISGH